MRKLQRICSMVMLMLMGLFFSVVQAQSYAKLWQQMEQAKAKGLPKTMIRVADQIILKAEREQNAPQLLKATVWSEAVQSRLTPDSIYAGIRQLEIWAAHEKNPVHRAIVLSLLAERYQSEMWKVTRYGGVGALTDLAVDEAPTDLREWSGNLFVAKIDACLQASLQEEEALLQASAKDYQPFVVLAEGSQFYAHDMYHLLANRALKAYQRLEGYVADSLVSRRMFDLIRHRATLYAHRSGAEDAALLTALEWVQQERDGVVKNADYKEYRTRQMEAGRRYLQQLDSLMARYGAREVCAEAYIKKASWLRNVSNGSLLDCLSTCAEGLKRYPTYKRISELRNIREEVQQPLLTGRMRTENYPGDTLNLEVQYRNLSGFTLHLYRTSFAQIPRLDDRITSAFIQKNGQPLLSKHITLVPTPKLGRQEAEWKYMRSDTLIQVVTPDETGVYMVQMVPDGGKASMEAQFFVLSRLLPLTLDLDKEGHEICVVDAKSGHPVEGVQVIGYDHYYDYQHEKVLQSLTTHSEGKAVFTHKDIGGYTVRKGQDAALPRRQLAVDVSYDDGPLTEEKKLVLLTDRSVYRPGQTVYVKGVAYSQKGWRAEVLKDTDYELVLLDVNRKEIASRKLRTNDFGSFTTEFILPSACLNGTFVIQSRDRRAVSYIQVEEYKRPTFEINFTPITEAYCLGEKVTLRGHVKAFNGRSVQQMPLAYTFRCTPWNDRRVMEPASIKNDTVLLDATGNFEIPLDLSHQAKAPDTFYEYHVEAVVTDERGETQTADYQFRASEHRYTIGIGLPQLFFKEDTINHMVHVSNQAHVPQSVSGVACLYRKTGMTVEQAMQKEPVWTGEFQANQSADFSGWRQLPSDEYCLKLTVRDSLGREQIDTHPTFVLLSKSDTRLPVFQNLFCRVENEEFDAQHPAVLFVGTSHQHAHVMMDVFQGKKRVASKMLQLNDTLMRMEYPYQASYGEGVKVLFTFVKHGRVFSTSCMLKKKQPNRTLDMKWEVFRDHLRPGQPEEWKLTIKRPEGLPAAAEMLAMLYDASLDKLCRHTQHLKVYHSLPYSSKSWYYAQGSWMRLSPHFPRCSHFVPRWTYDMFFSPMPVVENLCIVENDALFLDKMSVRKAQPMYQASEVSFEASLEEKMVETVSGDLSADLPGSVRKNFAETAFFYPQLRTNEQGEIVMSFTMPESLTRWNFRGYAHTQDMMTGQLDAEVVTAKEFMIQPNLPRYVRMGDRTQVSAVIANLTEKEVKGTARLTLFDPLTEKVLFTRKQKFQAESGRNAAVKFDFKVDFQRDFLGVRLTAEGGCFSDGEQMLLPVLSNQVFITETLPITVGGRQQKEVSLESLFQGNRPSATGCRLTVEFTGNPAWYAVQALPSMSVPTTDDATAYGVAYYTNTLASYIAASHPKIQAVIEQWKAKGGTPENFMSQLEKNQELKNIFLNESPWVFEATTEAEQRARIATLFDLNRLTERNYAALSKLKELQLANGAWSWYKGMPANYYTTAYITELLVRLPLMTGQSIDGEALAIQQKAFGYLHQEALEEFKQIKKAEKQGVKVTQPSASALTYLYLMALSGESWPEANRKVYTYWLEKMGGLLQQGSISQKAQAAIILWKAHREAQAQSLVASLCEHLIQEEEMGAHFAFLDAPYCWGMLPISIHVKAMEALQQVGGHEALLEEMKRWLLKQKQSMVWTSSVATADAVYALLVGGRNLLVDSGEVRITLGKHVLSTADPAAMMPGLNYVKQTYSENDTEWQANHMLVDNQSEGMAWGAVYAQYFAPMNEVRQQGGALTVKKQLFVERVDASGHPTLQPIGERTVLKVGDKVVSRLTMKLDRAMDFMVLKDQRGACFEPLALTSGYSWMHGFGTYIEIEDAATYFFFDHLGKGVYVLENACRLVRGGLYEAGIATAQSAYAPEFSAHSESLVVRGE